MRPPIRRFAPIGAITLVITSVAATAFLAMAQDGSPPICSTSPSIVGGEGPYLVENGSAMKRMMNDMTVAPTGDVDLDFVAMMVPHHQGAIDMAVAVLRHGRNPQIRRLAQEIIVTQRQEITAMRLAVGQPLPTTLPAPTQSQPLSAASYANARD